MKYIVGTRISAFTPTSLEFADGEVDIQHQWKVDHNFSDKPVVVTAIIQQDYIGLVDLATLESMPVPEWAVGKISWASQSSDDHRMWHLLSKPVYLQEFELF
jgi:hypothetical protein